jgi:uncharacterized membrane protein
MLRRLVLNLFGAWFGVWRWFPRATLARIASAIAAGERRHAGEVCFAVESRYAPWTLLNGRTVAGRAREVFAQLGVWDTQDNSGVLLYLQLAERRVEIVADRGIGARVAPAQWQAVCDRFALDLRARGLDAAAAEAAVIACIEQLHDLIAAQFPAADDNPREFPDDPIIL